MTKALGSAVGGDGEPLELPEPLASVLDYLRDDIDTRDFVPTAELVDALDVEPTPFGRQMGELGCQPCRRRITAEDGTQGQARGYTTADLRAATEEHRHPSWRWGRQRLVVVNLAKSPDSRLRIRLALIMKLE